MVFGCCGPVCPIGQEFHVGHTRADIESPRITRTIIARLGNGDVIPGGDAEQADGRVALAAYRGHCVEGYVGGSEGAVLCVDLNGTAAGIIGKPLDDDVLHSDSRAGAADEESGLRAGAQSVEMDVGKPYVFHPVVMFAVYWKDLDAGLFPGIAPEQQIRCGNVGYQQVHPVCFAVVGVDG